MLRCASTVLASGVMVAGIAVASAQLAIPDFSSTAWQTGNGGQFAPVPGWPLPTRMDPAHPLVSNDDSRAGKQATYRMSDVSNPNIKQWAKDIMKKDNDEVLAGKVPYSPGSSCKPWGVPAMLSQRGGPIFFMQTPKKVLLVDRQDRFTRHIYMNVGHSPNPTPSWHGESVGHYEGDTLVIDTIGLSTKAFVDNYRTPHTENLHVVERWRTINDGRTIEVEVYVEDAETFTLPWKATRRFERTETSLGEEEYVCQEGNFVLFDFGTPVAAKPDF